MALQANWDDLRLLLAVSRRGSLLQAGQLLGIAASTVSRRLTQLEAALGEPLVERGVEGCWLTARGQSLVEVAVAAEAGLRRQTERRAVLLVQGAGKTLRDDTEGQRMGQDLVVPGEVTHRQQIDACILLQLPVIGSQLATNALQCGLIDIAFPVGFECFFQLAVCANAGETKSVGQGHDDIPSCK